MTKYDPNIHHRRSIRLPEYDYSQPGAYFLTLRTYEKACFFGDVVDGEMKLNEFGRIVHDEWMKSAQIRAEIALDEFVVMPNHLHGIVFISGIEGEQSKVGANVRSPLRHRGSEWISIEIVGIVWMNCILASDFTLLCRSIIAKIVPCFRLDILASLS